MESSSEDGSFVWTDASNSSSSEDMVMNTGGANSGDELSENGKNYKKKLHKVLFSNENGKHEVRNKKRKREGDTWESEHSGTAKKIKVEPESDLDVGRVQRPAPAPPGGGAALNGLDEQLLDQKVKIEQEFLLPSETVKKKKRKKSTSCENVETEVKLKTNLNETEEKPSNEFNTEGSSSRFNCNVSDHRDEYNATKKKKKKKKSEKREESPCDIEIDDQYTVDHQTTISNQSRRKDTLQREKHPFRDETEDCDNVSRDPTMDSNTVDLDISEISRISNVNVTRNESLTVQNNKDRRRLSERIQFEDDIVDSGPRRDARVSPGALSGELAGRNLPRAKKPNEKLKRFAEKNNKLRACAVTNLTEFTIDERDEVWVVTCPSDADLAAFVGRRLELEGRCKVKLQGASYEGAAAGAPAGARAALLLGAGGGARLRGVALAGRLALHRRLPRAPDASPATPATRPARVPLPDTKLRHPLLGAHYKKALKVPPAVAERLRAAPAPAPARAPKRRRKSEAPPALAEAHAPTPSKKKAKRKKHDLEAAETWESERAIEESLFDF